MDVQGGAFFAEYKLFKISDKQDGYRLKIDGYSMNEKDSLRYQNNMKFSTMNHDSERSYIS